ncbi:methyltransferase domain-containing protein [Mesorhizobium sp.]|uniref:methyltransferase domain-containing protein n=1 Tax=Mesorhizobium sp. TaxID=1871066 RepID=UPI0025D0D9E7|nr:methyltransferase domain-containing protein [Mesorhizobium sp.]
MANVEELRSYIIKGGEEGRSRLALISRVLAPATRALLDRFEPLNGMLALDAGCGGGDVSFELAARVGSNGRVVGFDLDEEKLAAAREEAANRGLANVAFHKASVLDPWPISGAALVYIRFVLTHLASPEEVLARARAALAPGGVLIVEDIDYAGQFCDPPCPAVDRYSELFVATLKARGGDPFIGRRLVRLLESAGFASVDSGLVQPFGRSRDIKQTTSLTMAAIAGAVAASGIATAEEVDHLTREIKSFADRSDTTISLPRIFQAWGRMTH